MYPLACFPLTSHISCFKKEGKKVAKNIHSHFLYLCGFAVSDSLGSPELASKTSHAHTRMCV